MTSFPVRQAPVALSGHPAWLRRSRYGPQSTIARFNLDPELMHVTEAHDGRPVSIITVTPAEHDDRVPLSFYTLSATLRPAVHQIMQTLKTVAVPFARIVTDDAFEYHVELLQEQVLNFLHETNPRETPRVTYRPELANEAINAGYDGINPENITGALSAIPAPLPAADMPHVSNRTVRRIWDDLAHLGTLSAELRAGRLENINLDSCPSDWVPPRLIGFFSPPDVQAHLNELLQEDYQLAMECGEEGWTAAYDVTSRRGRHLVRSYLDRRDRAHALILKIQVALLELGAKEAE